MADDIELAENGRESEDRKYHLAFLGKKKGKVKVMILSSDNHEILPPRLEVLLDNSDYELIHEKGVYPDKDSDINLRKLSPENLNRVRSYSPIMLRNIIGSFNPAFLEQQRGRDEGEDNDETGEYKIA